MLEPYEITECDDEHTASFKYRDGIEYAQTKKLNQTDEFRKVREFTHFIVCCGDVMIAVRSDEFPNIERRAI